MAYFKDNNKKRFVGGRRPEGGSRPSFGGGKSFGRGPREELKLYSAVCADCGKSTEVPFKPTGSKPVFCRDCFKGKEDDGGRDSFSRKPSFGDRGGFKPRFEGKRFEGREERGGDEAIKKQLDAINKKLDTLIQAFEDLADEEETED